MSNTDSSPKKAELSTVIQALRQDLAIAMQEGEGKDIRFNIDNLEVELKTTIGVESKGTGGIKFWIAELGGEYADKNEVVHTVRLTLDPVKVTENDEGEEVETSMKLSAEE